MTGAEHYREAEQLLLNGHPLFDGTEILVRAQIHATLAVAELLADIAGVLSDRTLTVDVIGP